MSGDIENLGRKGTFMMKLVIGFILFILLWASVYYANFQLEFDYPLK